MTSPTAATATSTTRRTTVTALTHESRGAHGHSDQRIVAGSGNALLDGTYVAQEDRVCPECGDRALWQRLPDVPADRPAQRQSQKAVGPTPDTLGCTSCGSFVTVALIGTELTNDASACMAAQVLRGN